MIRRRVIGNLAGLALMLGILVDGAIAQPVPEMPHAAPAPTQPFRQIEQPLALKLAVTLGGLALIGLEIGWFLLSKPQTTKGDRDLQEVTITVDGGYEPSRVLVKAGQPVRLNFLRRDPSSCLETVLLPDFQIAQDLALDRVTPLEFTPERPGQYPFTCGMNLVHGVVEVRSA